MQQEAKQFTVDEALAEIKRFTDSADVDDLAKMLSQFCISGTLVVENDNGELSAPHKDGEFKGQL